MFGRAKKRQLRGSPRYRLKGDDHRIIKFMSKRARRISTTQILDISESGIAFTTAYKIAPDVGEIIKMEFAPLGSMQMACLGRVARIEIAMGQADWAKFPDTVKVGVSFYQLPKPYGQVIADTLQEAFKSQKKNDEYVPAQEVIVTHSTSQPPRETWFETNWRSLIATAILLLALAYGTVLILENIDTLRPRESTQWSEGFFKKVIKKPPEK